MCGGLPRPNPGKYLFQRRVQRGVSINHVPCPCSGMWLYKANPGEHILPSSLSQLWGWGACFIGMWFLWGHIRILGQGLSRANPRKYFLPRSLSGHQGCGFIEAWPYRANPREHSLPRGVVSVGACPNLGGRVLTGQGPFPPGDGDSPWCSRLRRRRASLCRFMRQAARMLTRTATTRKRTPPSTPASTG